MSKCNPSYVAEVQVHRRLAINLLGRSCWWQCELVLILFGHLFLLLLLGCLWLLFIALNLIHAVCRWLGLMFFSATMHLTPGTPRVNLLNLYLWSHFLSLTLFAATAAALKWWWGGRLLRAAYWDDCVKSLKSAKVKILAPRRQEQAWCSVPSLFPWRVLYKAKVRTIRWLLSHFLQFAWLTHVSVYNRLASHRSLHLVNFAVPLMISLYYMKRLYEALV